MASNAPAAGEGSQLRGDDGPTLSQNTAACSTPAAQYSHVASPSSPSDSKRSDAARLARELGSSSPWSEALMPHTYGVMSPRPALTNARPDGRQEIGNIDHLTAHVEQDLGPPPAYSRSPQPNNFPQAHELPAEPMDPERPVSPIVHDQVETQSSPHADIEQDHNAQEVTPDTETPLLNRPSTRSRGRGRGGKCWRWIQSGKTRRRRFCRLLCAVILFSTVALVLVCILTDVYGSGSSFFNQPPKSAQPNVPTGPDYRRHETVADIKGSYKLYDRIELTTGTGVIDVEIEPQSGDRPAILILSSDFGGVTLRVSSAYYTQRNRVRRTIYTEIRSLTGSVSAQILLGHGGYALVDTTTGVQRLSVLATGIGPNDEISNLTTMSRTGTQNVVLSSPDPWSKTISNLHAEHHALGTASLDISYPSAWMGEVRAVAAPFGVVSVVGRGLKYTRQDQDTIVAHRGSNNNPAVVNVISEGTGSTSFTC